MSKFTKKDLIALTLSELEEICALIMDTITERQGKRVAQDFPLRFEALDRWTVECSQKNAQGRA